MLRKRIPVVLTLLVVLIAGVWWGGHPDDLPGFMRRAFVAGNDLRVVTSALDRVSSDYYRPVRRSDLVDASIAGVISRLGDRFSNYFNPRQYREYTELSNNQFSGIGVDLRVPPPRAGQLVVHVFPATPAARAGMRSGDLLVSAAGHSLAGLSVDAAKGLVAGPPGTDVVLGVARGRRRFSLTLTRATVSVPVVAEHVVAFHGRRLAEVALATFSSGAHGELRQAVDTALSHGAKGIVLDLRNNGGGLVEEARLVASIFVAQGTIVTTRGRSQPTQVLSATGDAIPSSVPVVVLVDRNTASAAEIVTAALQDHRRAVVVGTHTFGKGVFQEVESLSNGGALDITVGEYFTPDGRNLGGGGVKQGAGITPDVVASDNPRTHRDEAMDLALAALSARVR